MSSQDETVYSDEFLKACEEISDVYDRYLETIAEGEEIGFCGYICDGECTICKGAGTFDSADEY